VGCQQTGATLIGVDPSAAGLAAARRRAERAGLASRATFQQGTFEQTGLPDASADGAVSIEAFQYAPDKRAALAELHRILRPGARIGIVCFEVDPSRVAELPVQGVDPHSEYAPILEAAGFAVHAYQETPGWASRVYGTFQALVDAADALVADLGERAAAGVLAEAMFTLQTRPCPRRILLVAKRLDQAFAPKGPPGLRPLRDRPRLRDSPRLPDTRSTDLAPRRSVPTIRQARAARSVRGEASPQ
jgi:SAM-dependent methyltransferase